MISEKEQSILRKKYNPDGSELRQHQLKMLDILIKVDEVCNKYGIKYWLSSGTCLGAVRHGGFIPWDDDLDIEMLRDDYLRFIRVFKETDQLVLQTHKNDRFYSTPFAKVRIKDSVIYDSLYRYSGVFIDILCIEYTNRFFSVLLAKERSLLNKFYGVIKTTQSSLSQKILSQLFICFKTLFFMSIGLSRLISMPLPYKKLRHTYGTGWVDNVREESDIFPLTKLLFEGIAFPVPGHYERYLSRIYGDYNRLPSSNEIGCGHVQFYNKR